MPHTPRERLDGSTIKVAGSTNVANFPNAATGAKARFERFNDNNEIKGVEIEWTEFADDKEDAALALAEARRLVTQDGVFAIVGDVSPQNPALLPAAEGAVLRLGIRRHVLQHGYVEAGHEPVRLRLQRVPRAREPKVVANFGDGTSTST